MNTCSYIFIYIKNFLFNYHNENHRNSRENKKKTDNIINFGRLCYGTTIVGAETKMYLLEQSRLFFFCINLSIINTNS